MNPSFISLNDALRWCAVTYAALGDPQRVSRILPTTCAGGCHRVLAYSGKSLYKPEYLDVLFEKWRPIPLRTGDRRFEPSKEKPDNFHKVSGRVKAIQNGDSLFARVCFDAPSLFDSEHREWHLLCHDQANEVADFIYIEPEDRRLVLVHVKGAKKSSRPDGETSDGEERDLRKRERRRKAKVVARASGGRRVSVAAYEQVVEQAIKNLRHLDVNILYDRLAKSGKEEDSVEKFYVSYAEPGAVQTDCRGFMSALKRMKDKEATEPVLGKKVVVFQPHLRSSYWAELVDRFEQPRPKRQDSAEGETEETREDPELRLAFMLSSILIEGQVACLKRGIEFEVWSEAT